MTAIIEVEHLRKTYRGTTAVEDVSFTVRDGEIFGILGPNGAGKTTTVECLTGLRRPDGGSARTLGIDPHAGKAQAREVHRRVGSQLQEAAVPARMTVAEAVHLYASFYPHPADGDELLRTLGIEDKRDTYFKKLSGGQKQRLSIALALIGNPRVAVLDEVTTGLDPAARRETWALIERIRERGVTVVLVTHFMDEAERLCDRIVLIDHGRVAAEGSPAEVARQAVGGKVVRFRPSAHVDDAVLAALPEVDLLERHGERITVHGTADLANAVVLTLDRIGITAHDMTIEAPNLEDTFLALTEHPVHHEPEHVTVEK
jgi:ABC-2 type transport system ATP-binding protein